MSKPGQTGEEDKVPGKKAKQAEGGKLTEADKASTGRVGGSYGTCVPMVPTTA